MSESPPPTDAQVAIAVVRTGGIAGIRRQWRVEAAPDDAVHWIDLIDRCPWDQETDAGSGADPGLQRGQIGAEGAPVLHRHVEGERIGLAAIGEVIGEVEGELAADRVALAALLSQWLHVVEGDPDPGPAPAGPRAPATTAR